MLINVASDQMIIAMEETVRRLKLLKPSDPLYWNPLQILQLVLENMQQDKIEKEYDSSGEDFPDVGW